MTTDTNTTDDSTVPIDYAVTAASDVRERLVEEYAATYARVRTDPDAGEADVALLGFEDLSTAYERAGEVAHDLLATDGVADVSIHVDTDGLYDPRQNRTDPRPGAIVTATFTDADALTVTIYHDHQDEHAASEGDVRQISDAVETVGDLRDALDVPDGHQLLRVYDASDPNAVDTLGAPDDPVVVNDRNQFTIVERTEEA